MAEDPPDNASARQAGDAPCDGLATALPTPTTLKLSMLAQSSHIKRALAAPTTGADIVSALHGRQQGETVRFASPVAIAGHEFVQATILRQFHTGSQATLLRMLPGDRLYIFKRGDLHKEHALMCALRQMNDRWRQRAVSIKGIPLEAVTYEIRPLGIDGGLIEVVPESITLFDLSQECTFGERHLRIRWALLADPARLDRLAATTAAYLTMCYSLGVRDGHDDNLMLRSDGAFFRVDFGFAFGQTPEIDTPAIFVPNAVAVALGRQRWAEVVYACGRALQALSGDAVRTLNFSLAAGPGVCSPDSGQPPAWDCLRSVPELGPYFAEVRAHTATLSFEAFAKELQHADRWTLSRAAKNSLREAVRFFKNDHETSSIAGLFNFDALGIGTRASGNNLPTMRAHDEQVTGTLVGL